MPIAVDKPKTSTHAFPCIGTKENESHVAPACLPACLSCLIIEQDKLDKERRHGNGSHQGQGIWSEIIGKSLSVKGRRRRILLLHLLVVIIVGFKKRHHQVGGRFSGSTSRTALAFCQRQCWDSLVLAAALRHHPATAVESTHVADGHDEK